MSKVTITIEDQPEGGVKCEATPTFEQMAMKINSGQEVTSAEAYALRALRAIRESSKEQGKLKLLLPRIGR